MKAQNTYFYFDRCFSHTCHTACNYYFCSDLFVSYYRIICISQDWIHRSKKLRNLWSCLWHIQSTMKKWVLNHRRVSSCTVSQERARLYSPRLLPTRQVLPSLGLWDQSLFRSTWYVIYVVFSIILIKKSSKIRFLYFLFLCLSQLFVYCGIITVCWISYMTEHSSLGQWLMLLHWQGWVVRYNGS